MRELPWERRQAIARECAQEIASHGDALLYKTKEKGATARAFAALARGLAVGAFAPGGITFAKLHFEAEPDAQAEESA